MKFSHFSIEEREKLQLLWWERRWKKRSIRSIAQELGRSPSSVSRELGRNFPTKKKVYAPRLAHDRALKKRKSRGRTLKLKNERIRSYVVAHLKQRWSPEQIAGRVKLDLGETISHEAIYQFIYRPISYDKPRRGCDDLRPYLRRRRKIRQPHGSRKHQRLFVPRGPSIDDRPVIVDQRKRVGDWEGDTVESNNHKPGINTLVERKVGLVLITKLKDKSSLATAKVMQQRFTKLPTKLKQTITLDNGPENRDWQLIQQVTGLDCYHAHPYCSGERGTNENTNGLIRDYFPKGTDFTIIDELEIARVEQALNTRPRKRLGWRTPLEALSVAIQS